MSKFYYTAEPELFYNNRTVKRKATITLYILIGLLIGVCAGLYVGLETMTPVPPGQSTYYPGR